MSWNYRIGTKVFSYKKQFEGKNEELAKNPDTRLFSIIEVYYDENNSPNGYTEVNALNEWETIKDLKGTYKLIKGAFTKPILDLDNFPNEWKEPSAIVWEKPKTEIWDKMKKINDPLKDVKQICDSCAKKAQLIMSHNHVATYWGGICDVCKEQKEVTDPMDFKYMAEDF